MRISESQYQRDLRDEGSARKNTKRALIMVKGTLKADTMEGLKSLTAASLSCKQYLCKNSTLKKLISIHQRVQTSHCLDPKLAYGSKKNLLEEILINISCLKETRESFYAENMHHQIQIY